MFIRYFEGIFKGKYKMVILNVKSNIRLVVIGKYYLVWFQMLISRYILISFNDFLSETTENLKRLRLVPAVYRGV